MLSILGACWRRIKRVAGVCKASETLPSGLPTHVHDDERLTRFLTSSRHFNAKMVKPAAWMPNPRNDETSVFRHGEHPAHSLWEIGRTHITGSRSLHGAAVIAASVARAELLEVKADEPPDRHANIIDWPSDPDDPELAKAKRKEKAAALASNSILLLPR